MCTFFLEGMLDFNENKYFHAAVPTEFWRPNYEGSVGSGTVTTVTLEEKDGAGENY